MAKLYDLSKIQQFNQQMDQAEEEIVEVLARTTMQGWMQKIERCGKSSRAVDVFLQLSLDLAEKQIKHYRKVEFKVVGEESGTFEREIRRFENTKMEIVLVSNDINHPKRKDYLFEMVENIARNVAKILVNQPIDDDQLKVALCIFEIHNNEVDLYDYQIAELKFSKEREPVKASRTKISWRKFQILK